MPSPYRYQQIADTIRGEIISGRTPAGTKLPAMSKLAIKYGVTIVTLQHSLSVLQSEGYVSIRQGFGTAVVDKLPPGPRNELSVIREELQQARELLNRAERLLDRLEEKEG